MDLYKYLQTTQGRNILLVFSSLPESVQYGYHQGHQFSAKEMALFFFMGG